jgi:hypothetical protein
MGVFAISALALPPTKEVAGRGFWSASLAQLVRSQHEPLPPAPEAERLRTEITSLFHPAGASPAGRLVEIDPSRRRPRHVLVVSLETAARRYYPIADNPEFPAFHAMSQRAIVSERHYSTMPFTTWAVFSILSGTYPPLEERVSKYGDFRADALGSALVERGFETTYIDSYQIDWRRGQNNRGMIRNLGFLEMVEGADLGTQDTEERERRALRLATGRLLDAHARGARAAIFLCTIRGHSPWRPAPGSGAKPIDVVHDIAHDFDALFAETLAALRGAGMEDEVILVVTGDHGLRYGEEYESLGAEPGDLEAAFNVPLLIHAPGVLSTQVRVPYLSSHVDIVPTLFDLMGIDTAPMVHHGRSLLDGALAGRATFFVNRGLVPVDAYHWSGRFFTFNQLTGHTEVATRADRIDARPFGMVAADTRGLPPALRDPETFLARLGPLLRLTIAYEVARARPLSAGNAAPAR